MKLYEHTIVTRQDAAPREIKQLTEKYSKIVEKNNGEVIKTENWGIINLSHFRWPFRRLHRHRILFERSQGIPTRPRFYGGC